ncbi:hypothetical protein [Pseudoduganella armeniaca]|uniref:hypothetical protein n=1 Tax=Pseudoduganella armeniaca TaxID=2072590 RepID=UPI0015E7236C|nr:hypothetical protein [Pseudoduganella armeniaca]
MLEVDAACKAAHEARSQRTAAQAAVPSNLIGIARLAFPDQLIEITQRAVVPD